MQPLPDAASASTERRGRRGDGHDESDVHGVLVASTRPFPDDGSGSTRRRRHGSGDGDVSGAGEASDHDAGVDAMSR
jgi:hypothetical protein